MIKQKISPEDLILLTFTSEYLDMIEIYNWSKQAVHIWIKRGESLLVLESFFVAPGNIQQHNEYPNILRWTTYPGGEVYIRPRELTIKIEPELLTLQHFFPGLVGSKFFTMKIEIFGR